MKINNIGEGKTFKPIEYRIVFESQEELDEAQGVLNHAFVVGLSPLLSGLSSAIGYESNQYYYAFTKELDEKIEKDLKRRR